ncbi:hypothetical protein VP01_1994g2 [Puccinia sorghi]|uniref:Uncharacterized protein n=1 Tax=Puccinia sorghi TaxID=27349 RepID=A0A0L6VDE6_9BASI|nr:hypothetical protein VP01_1994g2 [Puccinia sorghi]
MACSYIEPSSVKHKTSTPAKKEDSALKISLRGVDTQLIASIHAPASQLRSPEQILSNSDSVPEHSSSMASTSLPAIPIFSNSPPATFSPLLAIDEPTSGITLTPLPACPVTVQTSTLTTPCGAATVPSATVTNQVPSTHLKLIIISFFNYSSKERYITCLRNCLSPVIFLECKGILAYSTSRKQKNSNLLGSSFNLFWKDSRIWRNIGSVLAPLDNKKFVKFTKNVPKNPGMVCTFKTCATRVGHGSNCSKFRLFFMNFVGGQIEIYFMIIRYVFGTTSGFLNVFFVDCKAMNCWDSLFQIKCNKYPFLGAFIKSKSYVTPPKSVGKEIKMNKIHLFSVHKKKSPESQMEPK